MTIEMNAFKSFNTFKQFNPFDGAICRFERLERVKRFEQRRLKCLTTKKSFIRSSAAAC